MCCLAAIYLTQSLQVEMPPLINDSLLEMLRCPQDRCSLTRAEQKLVERTNRAITAGQLVNLAGVQIEKQLDGGLVRAAGDVMYPVIDGIPVMLPDEAIELSQLEVSRRELGEFESTEFESTGFESTGFASSRFESSGFESSGLDSSEFDSSEFDSSGFDSSGFDSTEYDSAEYESTEFDSSDYDSTEFDSNGCDSNGPSEES